MIPAPKEVASSSTSTLRKNSELLKRWDRDYTLLGNFIGQHRRLPRALESSHSVNIGIWVSALRQAGRDQIPENMAASLEAFFCWSWDEEIEIMQPVTAESSWGTQFKKVKEFVLNNNAYPPSETDLGKWVIRQQKNQAQLSAKKQGALESIPNWVWKTSVRRHVPSSKIKHVLSLRLESQAAFDTVPPD
jgi:hypothetical protein